MENKKNSYLEKIQRITDEIEEASKSFDNALTKMKKSYRFGSLAFKINRLKSKLRKRRL